LNKFFQQAFLDHLVKVSVTVLGH